MLLSLLVTLEKSRDDIEIQLFYNTRKLGYKTLMENIHDEFMMSLLLVR